MSTSSFKTRSVVATAEQKRIVSPSNEGASGQSSTIQDCCQKVPEPPSLEGFSIDIEMTNADLLRLTGEQPIAFHRCFARCFGVNAGLLLGYLLKWRGANDEVYRTEKQIENDTCLTPDRQSYARKILKKHNVLQTRRKGIPAQLYYSINMDALVQALASTSSGKTGNKSTRPSRSTKQSKELTEEIREEPKDISRAEQVCAVFEFWAAELNHPHSLLNALRKSRIEGRLKDGYTVDQIKMAILGCKKSPHHMGKNDHGTVYDDIELICRDGVHLERFISFVNGANQNAQSQPSRYENSAQRTARLFRERHGPRGAPGAAQ